MPRRLIDLGAKPLLDVASYARRGPGRRDRLSHDEIELIVRTVRRTPEVMVKVLSRGGQDLKGIGRHLGYLNRGGEVDIETDDGQRLSGEGVEKELLEDWDLDLEEHRRKADLESRSTRPPPKLVHKLMFSMPAGTPPDKVLAAVKNFAREEFGLKHRYAMVLHTDEPHPHVHMVVKAMSEQGVRSEHSQGDAAGMETGSSLDTCARWASPPTPQTAAYEGRVDRRSSTASIEQSNVANPATPGRERKQWRLSC